MAWTLSDVDSTTPSTALAAAKTDNNTVSCNGNSSGGGAAGQPKVARLVGRLRVYSKAVGEWVTHDEVLEDEEGRLFCMPKEGDPQFGAKERPAPTCYLLDGLSLREMAIARRSAAEMEMMGVVGK